MHKNESIYVAAGTKTSELPQTSIASTVLHSVLLVFILLGAGWLGVFLGSISMGLAFFIIFVLAPLSGMLLTLFSRFHAIELFWAGVGGIFFLFPALAYYEVREFPFIFSGGVFFEIPVLIISLCFFEKNKIKPPEYDKKYALFRECPKIILSVLCLVFAACGFFGFSMTLVGAFLPMPLRPDGLNSLSDYYIAGLMFALTLVMLLFSRFKATEFFIAALVLLFVLLPLGIWFPAIALITIFPFGAAIILAAVIKNTKLHR